MISCWINHEVEDENHSPMSTMICLDYTAVRSRTTQRAIRRSSITGAPSKTQIPARKGKIPRLTGQLTGQ
jgi:hypothetical protein